MTPKSYNKAFPLTQAEQEHNFRVPHDEVIVHGLFKITRGQREQLKAYAKNNGYPGMSNLLREILAFWAKNKGILKNE